MAFPRRAVAGLDLGDSSPPPSLHGQRHEVQRPLPPPAMAPHYHTTSTLLIPSSLSADPQGCPPSLIRSGPDDHSTELDTTLPVLDGRNMLLAISHSGCSNWMCPVKPATFEHCKRRYGSLNPDVLGSAGEERLSCFSKINRSSVWKMLDILEEILAMKGSHCLHASSLWCIWFLSHPLKLPLR